MKKFILSLAVFLLISFFMSTSAVEAANGSIRGAVFLDNNANGLWETNEAAVAGVYVTVYSTGDWANTFFTGTDGTYAAVALSNSNYIVELTVPAGFVPTTPARRENITIGGDAGILSLNNNFGIAPFGTKGTPPYYNPYPGSPYYNPPPYGQPYTPPATSTVTTTYTGRIYTVKVGDTLFRIALNHGVSLHALRAANGLHGNLIYAGQQLLIPDTKVISTTVTTTAATPTPPPPPAAPTYKFHVVKAGENLYRIALYYGVPLQTLAAANSIVNPSLIYVGQVLVIP